MRDAGRLDEGRAVIISRPTLAYMEHPHRDRKWPREMVAQPAREAAWTESRSSRDGVRSTSTIAISWRAAASRSAAATATATCLENTLEDALHFLKVWSAKCLNWFIMTRAHAPRQTIRAWVSAVGAMKFGSSVPKTCGRGHSAQSSTLEATKRHGHLVQLLQCCKRLRRSLVITII